VEVQGDPDGQGLDPATGKVYITNQKSDTLSVIVVNRCSASNLPACAQDQPATIQVGSGPDAILANPAKRTVYVVDNGDNNLTLLPEI
jgi:DNA-binding beta-propeller fold protein YncE